MCFQVVPDWFFTLKQLQSTSGTLYSPVPALQTHTLLLGLLYSEIDFLSHKEPIYWKQENPILSLYIMYCEHSMKWEFDIGLTCFPNSTDCIRVVKTFSVWLSTAQVHVGLAEYSVLFWCSRFRVRSPLRLKILLLLTLKPLRLPEEPRVVSFSFIHQANLRSKIWGLAHHVEPYCLIWIKKVYLQRLNL